MMAFGLIFVWAFNVGGALLSAIRFAGDVTTTQGMSSSSDRTNFSINDEAVFATSYDFRSTDGMPFSGISYATGNYIEEGRIVAVEYVSSDPTVSRIVGMRTTQGGLGVAFVLIFPILGLVMALAGMRKGLRARHLMSTGQLGLGRLKSKEATNTRVNNQTVYRYTFDFEAAAGGIYQVSGKSHRLSALEDEPVERIMYDPRNPSEAALLDELPCRPEIDPRGNFGTATSRELVLAGLNLLLPVAALLSYAAYFLTRR
jgi:hypothetical protein